MSKQQIDIQNALHSAYALYEARQYHECVELCTQILSFDCTRAEVWSLAGLVLLELDYCSRALPYLEEAHRLKPSELAYTLNLAEAHRRAHNPAKCAEILTHLLESDARANDNPTLHFNLAKAYSDMENPTLSIFHYGIAIKLDPNDLGAMFNLANAKVSLKQFGEAVELYISALERGYLDAGVNLANTYTQMGLFSEAISVYEALFTHYEEDGDFLFNYANALNYARHNLQLAQTLYQRAIALNPSKAEYCINYAHFLLRCLQLPAGFRIYEERKRLPNMLPKGITKLWSYTESWRVENLEGKDIVLYHEQGLGDTIMFARFLPLVRERAGRLRLIIQPPLVSLFENLGYECISSEAFMSERAELGAYDMALSLLSLPLALGVSRAEQLSHTHEIADLGVRLMREVGAPRYSRLKVGICFSTDSQFPQAESKNIPLQLLLGALTHCEVYSLNKATQGRLGGYEIEESRLNDFMDTARVIAGLDVVVSIDSAVAHLAASVGKPTLVLLHKCYDWRWGNGVATPWYENVRAITQSKMGDWHDVVENLGCYLQTYQEVLRTQR